MTVLNRITPEHINKIIEDAEYDVTHRVYDKVCVVVAKLKHNGFTIVGHGACVDPANYSEEIGYNTAVDNIKEQLWLLEGYSLQNKLFGV